MILDRAAKAPELLTTHILAVQFDELPGTAHLAEPVLRIVDWYERSVLGMTLNEAAHAGQPTLLVFDELQNVPAWAPQLKFLVDQSTTTVLVTGSSALQIEAGRDSLAGRITSIEAGALSLTEIALFHGLDLGEPFLADNGLAPLRRKEFWIELRAHGRRLAPARDAAFAQFSARGAYPLAHQRDDVAVDGTFVAESVVEAILSTIPGLRVSPASAHANEPGVDFDLLVGDVRIPLEVKYQRRIDPFRDTEGLRSFMEKSINRAPFGLLVTQTDIEPPDDPRIVALPLATLMLAR